MLIKRKNLMTSKSATVKKTSLKLILVTVLTAAGYSPSSFAQDSMWMERVVSVKFSRADLSTEQGLKAVYAKIEKKAHRTCRADRNTLSFTGQSKSECVEDLMDQFVKNSNAEVLQNYHLSAKKSDA